MSATDEAPYADTGLVVHPSLDGTAGEAELMAFAPGPAGTARAEVHAEVSVEVDFAEPDRLCSVFADDVGASRTLEGLIGRAAFRAVRTALLTGDERSRRVSVGGDIPNTARRRPGRPSGLDPAIGEFAWSLAARAVGDDPYELDVVRAVAHVEGAAHLLRTPWSDRIDLGLVEENMVFATETLVGDTDVEALFSGLDLKTYAEWHLVMSVVVRWPAWTARPWAQELAARFPRRLFDLDEERRRRNTWGGRDVVYGSPIVELSMDLPAMDFPAMRSESIAPAVPEPTVQRLGPGRYVYRFTRQPKGAWLRVIDSRTQVLLALAPLKRESGRYEAHVVLPTSVDVAYVITEPTDTPVVGSASTLDTMLDAIDHGRAAARLSAAGDRAATDRWHLCARLWNELGDATRAGRAVAYATGREQVTRPAFLHDVVRDATD